MSISSSQIESILNSSCIYEDELLMVINKPPGVVVNQAATTRDLTVQGWFFQKLGSEKGAKKIVKNQSSWEDFIPESFSDKYGSPQEIFLRRQGLVHRLDKDTSGVLFLAKDPGTLVNLLGQFRKRLVKKKYLCLVHGTMRVSSTTINAPINRSRVNRHKFSVDISGRSAKTHYRVVEFFSAASFRKTVGQSESLNQAKLRQDLNSYQQGFSLLECLPETGRTHQIRVHLAHIGHPIVADRTYGGGKRSALDRRWCPRQFLHAAAAQINHPKTQKRTVFKADLTPDLHEIIDLLSFS